MNVHALFYAAVGFTQNSHIPIQRNRIILVRLLCVISNSIVPLFPAGQKRRSGAGCFPHPYMWKG